MVIELPIIFGAVAAVSFGSNRLSHYFRKRPDSFSMPLTSYLAKEGISEDILVGIPDHDVRIIEKTSKGRFVLGHIENERNFKPVSKGDRTIIGIFARCSMAALGAIRPWSTADIEHNGPASLGRVNKYDTSEYLYMPKKRHGNYVDFGDKRVNYNQDFFRLLNIFTLAHELKHTEQNWDKRDHTDGIAIEGEADIYALYALETVAPLSNMSQFIMHRRALFGLDNIFFNLFYKYGAHTAADHETTLILDAWRQGQDLPTSDAVKESVKLLIAKLGRIIQGKHDCPIHEFNYERSFQLMNVIKRSDIIDHIDIEELRAENALSARLVELWVEAYEASSKPLDEYLPVYQQHSINVSPA